MNAADPANLVNVTLAGIAGRGKYAAMPSFAAKLSDQQISTLLNYIRTSWGNTANPNVSPALVRRRREQSGLPVSRLGAFRGRTNLTT